MANVDPFPKGTEVPIRLSEAVMDQAVALAIKSGKAFRKMDRGPHRGLTLRPGKQTPLWNELREQLKPYLSKYGEQANLARVLGLPRQRVNDFVTGGALMPDAERTLQLVVWLAETRKGRRPV